MPSVFALYLNDDARYHYRIGVPIRHLQADFPHVNFSLGQNPGAVEHDVYILHSIIQPQSLVEIGRWKERGGLFVWSLDDDYTCVPDWNPARPGPVDMASFFLLKRLADIILVSTPALARSFLGKTEATVIEAPNLTDLDYYPTAKVPPDKTGPIRILWSGSETHIKDVDVMAESCARVLRDLGKEKVEFHFFGQQPPSILLRDFLHQGVLWHSGVALHNYWSHYASIAPHIVLAPMANIKFNESKSAIRVFDAWANSAAVIASDWGEYGAKVEDGRTGLKVAPGQTWDQEIRRLVLDRNCRHMMAEAGRKQVETYWSWQGSHAGREAWKKAITAILAEAANRRF